jgi:hypothetical protein
MDPELIKAALEAVAAGDEKKALEILKQMITSAAGGAPAEAAPEAASALEASGAPAPKTPEEEAKMLRAELAAAKANRDVAKLRAELDVIKAERDAVEAAERADLVAELVRLSIETPATAWQGDPKDRKPKARFEAEPIAELRERVALRKAEGPLKGPEATPPVGDEAAQVVALSKHQLQAIKARGLTPEQFIAAKNRAVRRI